jgi:hypothetical protein
MQPRNQKKSEVNLLKLIDKPFETEIDVTGDTPFDQVPETYWQQGKSRSENQQQAKIKTELLKLSINKDIFQLLLAEIHHTVSHHDDHVVRVAFHAGLSAYAKPLNLALRAESGSGKTYSTTQTVLFLPQEDVFYIASQSPKVISHEHGVKKTDDGCNFDEIPEPQKPSRSDYPDYSQYDALLKKYYEEKKAYQQLGEDAYYEVDLRKKVIIFLESVNPDTFKMLKATMSHDNEENGYVDHKYVDDKGKVHKTRLVGAPCLIFNSLDNEYVSEFATRCLTATPNTSKEKIAAAMEISNKKSSFPWEYEKENFSRLLFQEYIRKIRDTLQKGKIGFVNPFTIHTAFNKEQTRSMRDFNHYLELIAPYPMFKLFQRPVIVISGKRYLLPTIEDVLNAKTDFDAILQTTQTGTEQRIISFYFDVVAKHPEGTTVEQLTDEYNKGKKKQYSSRTIRVWLDRLVEIEWVDEREREHFKTNKYGEDYVDKRFLTYVPMKQPEQSETTVKLTTAIDLRFDLEKSFKKWLQTVAEKISITHPPIICRIDGSANQITLEELTNIVLGIENDKTVCGVISESSATVQNPNSDSIREIEPETIAVTENTLILYYRKLPPNTNLKCEGEGKGSPCTFFAQYEMLSSDNPEKPHYCKTHFQATAKNCQTNNFQLVEKEVS